MFMTGVNDTCDKFITGVNDNPCHGFFHGGSNQTIGCRV
jgi:hypothetical protein